MVGEWNIRKAGFEDGGGGWRSGWNDFGCM